MSDVIPRRCLVSAGGPVLEGGVDGGGLVSVEDLKVGGKYRIPKKKRGWCTSEGGFLYP